MQEPDKQEPASQESAAPQDNSQSNSNQADISKQQAQGQSVAGNAMASYAYEPPGSSTSSPKGKEKPKGLMKILTKLAAGITVVGCIILIIAVTLVSNLLKGLTDAMQAQGQRSTK